MITSILFYSGFWGWLAPCLLLTYIVVTAGLKERKRRLLRKDLNIATEPLIKSMGSTLKVKDILPTTMNVTLKTVGRIGILTLAFLAVYFYSQYSFYANRYFY